MRILLPQPQLAAAARRTQARSEDTVLLRYGSVFAVLADCFLVLQPGPAPMTPPLLCFALLLLQILLQFLLFGKEEEKEKKAGDNGKQREKMVGPPIWDPGAHLPGGEDI